MRITALRTTTTCGLALLAAALLSACSGGAATTANPNLSQQATQNIYTGPPPASADVEAFEQNVWVNISGSNRCGACHGVGGSGVPSFARSDDINQAYQAALTVSNLSPALELHAGGAVECRPQLLGCRATPPAPTS